MVTSVIFFRFLFKGAKVFADKHNILHGVKDQVEQSTQFSAPKCVVCCFKPVVPEHKPLPESFP